MLAGGGALFFAGLPRCFRLREGEFRPRSLSGWSSFPSWRLAYGLKPVPFKARAGDVACMKPAGVRLEDAAWMCVAENAGHVYHAVASGKMPPDAPWGKEQVALFKEWMDAGLPG